jgi:hypothetical protein
MKKKKLREEINELKVKIDNLYGDRGILIHIIQILCWKHEDLKDMVLVQNTAEQIKRE